MKKWGKWLALVLVCSMLLEGAALAADSTPRAEAAATTVKELRFRVGGQQATINGVVFKVAKPYQVNGTTMVPAGMLKQAFGLNVTWTVANKEFTIATGNRKAKMTVGKTRALINRKDVIMAQAPVVKNGNLMVPLRSVAEMLNATLSTSSNGQTIVKWDAKERYADMSRVGSKSGNWSMYLPEDWYYVDKSDVGYVSFFQENSSSGSMLLEIMDGTDYPNSTAFDLMDRLLEMYTLNSEIKDGSVNTKSSYPYAQLSVVYYDENDKISNLETSRMYQASNNDIYQLTVMGLVGLNTYTQMLNSFRPSYVMSGIPVVLNDPNVSFKREVHVKDMGITFSVPVFWYVDEYYGYAESQYRMQQVGISVNDAEGVSAELFAKKRNEYMMKTYVAGDVQIIEEKEFTLSSGQTGMLTRIVADHGNGKYTEYVVDVEDQGLLYSLSFVDSDMETGISIDAEIFMKQVKIDGSKASGDFEKPAFLEEWNAIKTYQLSKIEATIELPSSWVDESDEHAKSYFFHLPFRDHLRVNKLKDTSISKLEEYEKDFFSYSDYTYNIALDETKRINGRDVRFIEYKYKENEYGLELIMSVAFIQDGKDLYEVCLFAYTTTYSDAVKEQFRKTVESLRIVK